MTKTLVYAVALTTLLAAPALAASKSRHVVRGQNAYAAAPYTTSGSAAVVFGNRVVGHDTDPNIRAEMLRDPVPSEY